MRTSILSRSVIAVATIGIGSVALAAAPATAATPSGITRDMVLTAAASIRADKTNDVPYTDATKVALRALSSRACDLSGDTDVETYGWVIEKSGSVDALTVRANSKRGSVARECTFAAIASTDPSLALSGRMTVYTYSGTDDDPVTTQTSLELSGDVVVSQPVTAEDAYADSGLSAAGATVGTTKVLETFKVPDRKTKSDKALARTKYETRVTNAKRAYGKALKRADSKAGKTAAKKAYWARKALAKSKFRYAVANYKFAKVRSTQNISRPFSVQVDAPQV